MRFGQKAPGLLSLKYIRSETKEIHLIYLSEVFQSIGQKSPRIQQFQKYFSTETQSIGIHDVHLFNTELAMHYRAIFNCVCFRLFCERERLYSRVLVYISSYKKQNRTRVVVVFCLIYCVKDFSIDFLRRLRSPDRLDGNENSMFTCRRPLGLIEENLKVGTHDGTSPCDWSLQQVAGTCRIVWTGN